MIRRLIIVIMFFIFVRGNIGFAQNNFSFDFDFAQFGYDSTANYVEFYYSYQQDQLTLKRSDSALTVTGKLSILLVNAETGEVIIDRNWLVNNRIVDTTMLATTSLVGVVGFAIPAGSYDCTITGSDAVDSTKSKTLKEAFTITPFLTNGYAVSFIQLASNIKNENVNKNSIFYKNTLEVMPNPTTVYSASSPVLFYYSEIYNLKNDSISAPLLLRKEVYSSQRRLIYSKEKYLGRDQNAIVEVGVITLKEFPTDAYTLVISLIDTALSKGVASSKKFYLFNPGVKDSLIGIDVFAGYIGSEFGVFSETECDELFDKSKYISTSSEITQYERLDSLNSKREFLYEFWKRRDTDPTTELNEFKEEYKNRLEFVKVRFKAFNKPGYKTDRGRIYLTYGEPDQVDRYPNETNMKPYEIWYYNSIEGGVVFIFGDLTGFSDYELLSSTKRGEMQDDSWTRRLITN